MDFAAALAAHTTETLELALAIQLDNGDKGGYAAAIIAELAAR